MQSYIKSHVVSCVICHKSELLAIRKHGYEAEANLEESIFAYI